MTYIEAFKKMHERFGKSFCASLAYFTLEKYDLYNPHFLTVKKVIFNDPATVILWDDGTKTVVKCQPGDTYDKEKGFVLAYLKKALGNDNTFNKEIHKWCPPDTIKELHKWCPPIAVDETPSCDTCTYGIDNTCKDLKCEDCPLIAKTGFCKCCQYMIQKGKGCPYYVRYKK